MFDEQDLRRALCHLQPGWALTVPDEWIERLIPGTRAERADRVKEIALDFGCALKQDIGNHIFERFVFSRTG